MKNLLTIILLTFIFFSEIKAQTTKGLSVVPTKNEIASIGNTFALIAGISKYKDAAMPRLQYADKDAIAFKNYLVRSGVDSNRIKLLLNEQATMTAFYTELQYLLDVAKQNDKLFIYFSGHGDVDSKLIVKDAYLLPYDTRADMYVAFSIRVDALKSYLETFSSKGVQVILLTDACHSGNLAGGREGALATYQMLNDKWKDEVKILSCQPNELSLESDKWGDGRGLFSYELINGLSGGADQNNDGIITLRELNLYLTGKVPNEAQPSHQNPQIVGNPELVMGYAIKQNAAVANVPMVKQYTSTFKNTANELLEDVDEETKNIYQQFCSALEANNLVEVEYKTDSSYLSFDSITKFKELPSASYYLHRINKTETNLPLLAIMKRQLGLAIVKEISKINDLKKFDSMYYGNPKEIKQKLNNFLVYSNKECFTLSEIMDIQKIKKLGVYSKFLLAQSLSYVKMHNPKALSILDSAILYDPNAVDYYMAKGNCFEVFNRENEALNEYKLVSKLFPNVEMSYFFMGLIYSNQNKLDSAKLMFNFVKSDSMRFYGYFGIARTLAMQSKLDSAHQYLELMENCISHMNQNGLKSEMYYAILGMIASMVNDCQKITYYYLKFKSDKPNQYTNQMYVPAAQCFLRNNDKLHGLKCLEFAFQENLLSPKNMYDDEEWKVALKMTEVQTLIQKYFSKENKEK